MTAPVDSPRVQGSQAHDRNGIIRREVLAHAGKCARFVARDIHCPRVRTAIACSLRSIFLTVLPTISLAADPNQAAEREARQFLTKCPPGEAQETCLIHQRNFIEQYVYAKAGDHAGQTSTAASFDMHHPPDDTTCLGLPQNQIQSCAWRIVIVQFGAPSPYPTDIDARMIQDGCGKLSPVEMAISERRADELLRELRTHPAATPSDDWEPRVAGLAPTPPVNPHCLATLDLDGTRLYPPGCPGSEHPKTPPTRR